MSPQLQLVSSRAIRCLFVAVASISCGQGETPRIGVGIPALGVNDVLAMATERIGTMPQGQRPELVKWSLDGPTVLETAWGQASLFARDKRVVGVVGHLGSRDALLAANVYNASGVPHIVPTATASQLTEVGPWTFVMVPDNLTEGKFMAAHAVDSLRAERLLVFYVGDEYGAELRDGVSAELRARNRGPADVVLVPGGGCDTNRSETYEAIVRAAVARTRPDAVILATGVVGAECILPRLVMLAPGIPVLGADGVDLHSRRIRALPDQALSVLRSVVFWRPGTDSLHRSFAAAGARTLPYVPGPFDALLYDSFMLMAAAVAEAGPSREGVRDWLLSLGHARPAFQGVTGPVVFEGQRRRLPMYVERYQATTAPAVQ